MLELDQLRRLALQAPHGLPPNCGILWNRELMPLAYIFSWRYPCSCARENEREKGRAHDGYSIFLSRWEVLLMLDAIVGRT